MKTAAKNPSRKEPRGMALVIVLAFVVLLTGLVLAYFSHSMLARKISDGSLGDTRARQLGESALDVIVSDLKQEIASPTNSTLKTVGTNTFYLPVAPSNAIPERSGNPALTGGIDPIPNLVRRSVRSDSISFPSKASAVNSATDPSQNKRFVSPARWNKHYLIPRSDKGTNIDSTPNASANFTAPDWVYVTSNGPEVLTAPSANVIGRYAFTIYDEGGLLDMNVAGFTSSTPTYNTPHPSPNSLDLDGWGSGAKGSVAFADLTSLTNSAGALLTQSQVDQIVGWRNYATAQPSGSFGNFTFSSTDALRYHDYVKSATNGFLSVSDEVRSGGTDHAFTSRLSLLKLREAIGFSQDALQYMGTFSRDLNQPSFIPNPNRPKIQSDKDTNKSTYGTGNDAYGLDRETDPTKDINPPFPLVRVEKAFTRPDGSAAQLGDPLMKKRFPLSHLSEILRTATASKSQSDPIYRNFGIYRSSTSDPWKYDHGDSTGILRLSEVAQEGREPDFFEILKAAINVGSLGKGICLFHTKAPNWSWKLNDSFPYFQQQQDILTGLQTLQIGANIIDQYDSDNFPTSIAFAGDLDREVHGVENLPYFYRIRLRAVKGVSTATPQMGMLFITPEVWNPHVPSTIADTPTQFRVVAENTLGSGVPTTFQVPHDSPGVQLDYNIDWSAGNGTPLAFTAKPDETTFREPTILTERSVPSGSNLTGNSFEEDATHKQIVGVTGTEFDWLSNGKGPRDALIGVVSESASGGPVTLSLQYHDGGWVTYDQQIYQWTDGQKLPLAGNIASTQAKGNYSWGGSRVDPRTSRWGVPQSEFQYLLVPIDLSSYIFPSQWPELSHPSYGAHFGTNATISDKGFTNISTGSNAEAGYGSPASYCGFRAGYWSANTVRNQKGFNGESDKPFYNRDPDGIARRAMGGYASDPNSGGDTSITDGLPMITGNTASRPVILNRPFRSVAELGYVFRGTPWKNLDFSFPESADAALLDAFCINDESVTDGLVAGKVNLNTRQAQVLKAIMAGALTGNLTSGTETIDGTISQNIADKLVERTISSASDKGPLANRSDLIGRWTGNGTSPKTNPAADPDASYSGFSADIGTADGVNGTPMAFVPAQRETAIRALGDVGNTRVWNLLIDVVAQAGRFPPSATDLKNFVVEGEKRYWLHIAIDRLTGEVLDKQLEVVSE